MRLDPSHQTPGPWGDPARHLSLEALERGFAGLSPPKDRGALALIVSRGADGLRATPAHAELSVDGGVPGDAWFRSKPDERDSQITMMRVDFGRLAANGQDLTLFGDNLLVDLDLSVANLPTGSLLQIGGASLAVTAEPHTGCRKYNQRFGNDALRMTADRRFRDQRLRGIHVQVVTAGLVTVGDVVEVVSRGS